MDIWQLQDFWHGGETLAHVSMTSLIRKVLVLCVKVVEGSRPESHLTGSPFSFFDAFQSAQIRFQSCQHDWQLHRRYP